MFLQWLVISIGLQFVTWSVDGGHVTTVTGSQRRMQRLDIHQHTSYTKDQHPSNRQYSWGEWGEQSPCSKPCGVGTRYRKRYCYKTSHNISHRTSISLCQQDGAPPAGDDRQYELCNTEACGGGGGRGERAEATRDADFLSDNYRIQQCSIQDRRPYRGKYYRWRPYIKAPSSSSSSPSFPPCALVCTSDGHPYKLAVKFSNTVRDGTHCLTSSMTISSNQQPGVCIAEECVSIGCDQQLYSDAVLDACGKCGGDNSTCDMVSNRLSKNISLGYSDLFTIPPHARHISVTETGQSPAVFALRSDHGIYFVNSRLSADNPTIYENVGGTSFYYYHPVYQANGKERMIAEGPTNETLHVMMLAPEPTVQISVKYSYTTNQPPEDYEAEDIRLTSLKFEDAPYTTTGPKFLPDVRYEENLVQSEEYWSPRLTNTIDKRDQRPTGANKYSRTTTDTNRTDKTKDRSKLFSHAYSSTTRGNRFFWREAKSACSTTCATTGQQKQHIQCYDSQNQIVDDSFCDNLSRPEPKVIQCEGKPCPSRWEASTWSKCSVSCGKGNQYRGVRCWRMLAPGMDSTVHDYLCEGESKPPTVRKCQEVECGPLWETSRWDECSNQCGPGLQYRLVHCMNGECAADNKPETVRQCTTNNCPNKWTVGEWSQCSGGCKSGNRKRAVTCLDDQGDIIHDKYCNQRKKPLAIEACAKNRADCPTSWVPQGWGVCSVSCGNGITHRQVVCGKLKQRQFLTLPDSHCSHRQKPPSRAGCQENPCKAEWYSTQWSECSKSCGEGGIRVRKVNCYINNRPSLACDYTRKPAVSERCTLPSCDSPPDSDPDCQDDPKTNCGLVVQVRLCRHWYYKKACCQACKHINSDEEYTSVPT